MSSKKQQIQTLPIGNEATLLIGFSGWMNGGEVATGTINYLVENFETVECGSIEGENYFLYNIPGDMEISELYRPTIKIKNGIVKSYSPPENKYICIPDHNLFLFTGREPNFSWSDFADCILSFCKRFMITRIFSIGSVAGLTPHTREPRISFSASNKKFRDYIQNTGLRPGTYEGPASFTSYLTFRAALEKINMASLVAEIPAYVEGYNPRCVETSLRLMARFLNLKLDLSELHTISEQFEQKISELVIDLEELAEKITELERDYDREAFDREMGNLKNWLRQQGLRAD